MAIAAQPGGAIETTLGDALSGYKTRIAYSNFDLTASQRCAIWNCAQQHIGTPYSFADYFAIAAVRIFPTNRLPDSAIERFVSDSGHMICSQLVDECYALAGIDLFPNRIACDVTPGDIANLIGAK